MAVVTGERDGYFATESSWWRDYIGSDGFVPFTPWFRFGEAMAGWLGVVAVVLLLAVVVLGLVRRSQRLGLELQTYTIGWVAYLVAVFLPQQSSFRMLMPLAPLLGDPSCRPRGGAWSSRSSPASRSRSSRSCCSGRPGRRRSRPADGDGHGTAPVR